MNSSDRNPWGLRATLLGLIGLALVLSLPGWAAAVPINLGAASPYTVLGLGSTVGIGSQDTVDANQATIVGNVAVGADTNSPTRAGRGIFQKGFIHGNLYVDTAATYHIEGKNFGVTGTTFGTVPAPPPPPPVHPNADGRGTFDLRSAVQAAVDASATYAGGTAIADINDRSATLTAGNYRVTNFRLNSDVLTITGGPSASFVLNVTGGFDVSHGEIRLSGGILADNVLFNVTGTGTTVTVHKDDSIFIGTLLAVNRDIIISELGVDSAPGAGPGNPGFLGRIIGALNHELTVHSGAQVTHPPTSQVPEPPTLLLLGSGLLVGGILGRKKSSTRGRELR